MDADRLELLRGLFAAVTEVLEDAHEAAIGGQNAHRGPASLLKAAEKLSAAARDLRTLTDAVIILARRT
jgi:hypothetical protein